MDEDTFRSGSGDALRCSAGSVFGSDFNYYASDDLGNIATESTRRIGPSARTFRARLWPGSHGIRALPRLDSYRCQRYRNHESLRVSSVGLRAAYSLPSTTAGAGQVVAIVDAYNDPNALSDVNTYRSTFGIPTISKCNGSKPSTSTNAPCFMQVNQNGSTSSLPRNNASWSQEISLDLDMVSAVCPNCSIVLAEASSASMTNLGTAVNAAANLGATEISNSYGGGESSSDTSYDSRYFNHPGIAITVSSGDSGYGVEYPAASQYVTAVGGTSLYLTGAGTSSASYNYETAWETSSSEGAGSGCSAYDPQPSWQSSLTNITGTTSPDANCKKRAVADVSAVADPNTGVSVYDSYSYMGQSGWLVFGGTSVASPLLASVYALAGNAASVNYGSYSYGHTSSLRDVSQYGHYTETCGTTLCNAYAGWDGPTGNGSPNGTGAF